MLSSFFFFKQNTSYELRIIDWSSDVCSSDLEDINDAAIDAGVVARHETALLPWLDGPPQTNEAGRSSAFIAAILWLADRGLPPRFQRIELGSSELGRESVMERVGPYVENSGAAVSLKKKKQITRMQ